MRLRAGRRMWLRAAASGALDWPTPRYFERPLWTQSEFREAGMQAREPGEYPFVNRRQSVDRLRPLIPVATWVMGREGEPRCLYFAANQLKVCPHFAKAVESSLASQTSPALVFSVESVSLRSIRPQVTAHSFAGDTWLQSFD